MEWAMSAYQQSGWPKRLYVSVFVFLGCVVAMQSADAQTRTLAALADVSVYVPAPYHPHIATAVHSVMLYDGYPYYAGAYWGAGGHYWH
jgi:hypothetical protein